MRLLWLHELLTWGLLVERRFEPFFRRAWNTLFRNASRGGAAMGDQPVAPRREARSGRGDGSSPMRSGTSRR